MSSVASLCARVVLVAALCGSAAEVAHAAPQAPADARIAAIRAEILQATPSPALLAKIPDTLAMAADFRAARDDSRAGQTLNLAVLYALLGGDPGQAVTLANQAARLCGAAGDRRCFGNAMNQSGIALLRLNDPYAAMQRLHRGARAFVEAGDIERAAIARLNAANIRYDIGDLAGALADYEAIDRLHGGDPRWDPVGMLNSKAEVLVRLGRLDVARLTARRAVAMLEQRQRSTGTRWESDVVNSTRGTLALVEASSGNAAAALPLYRDYLAAAERSGSPLERFNANFAVAEGLMKLGRPEAAWPHIATALGLIDETDPAGRRDAHDLASRIAAASGRTDQAFAQLRAAEAVRNELAAATLRSAIADANAQTAVAEREAALARRTAQWATQRTQLLGWTAFAVVGLILVAVTFFVRYRARTTEQRYAAVLDERTRMARELHDTLLQGFTGITLQLRAASKTDPAGVRAKLSAMADEAGRWVSETRHAVWDMRAATFDDALRAGLEQAVETARSQTGAEIATSYAIEVQPDPAVTRALVRIAQEALSNAARHAQASKISIGARTTAKQATLAVEDDGVGFTAAPELSALGGHWGLLGMRERVEALGGTFTVESTPGHGTRIACVLPV